MHPNPVISTDIVIVELLGFAVGLGLLWLGSALRTGGRALEGWLAPVPPLLSVVLVATGLWWPAHIQPQYEFASYLALALTVVLAPLAVRAGGGSLASTGATAMALGSFAIALIYVLLVRQKDGATVVTLSGIVMSMAIAAGLVVALAAPHAKGLDDRSQAARNVLCALLASLLVTVTSWHPGGELPWALMTMQLALLLTIIVLGVVLLTVLRNARRSVQAVAIEIEREVRDHDPLTGLATRKRFESHYAAIQRQAKQQPHTAMALLFINLDGFKVVNESYGRAVGDGLLVEMCKRLERVAGPDDVLARVGADEVLMLIRGGDDDLSEPDVDIKATRALKLLSAPYRTKERDVQLGCSIGIVMIKRSIDAGSLIARAEAAVQAAKRDGGGRLRFYDKSMESGGRERLALQADLRDALARNEFELYFQPKVDASSLQVTAAEALIRWHHPARGMVSPGEFIAVAEQSGLIGALGDWVIEAACRQAAAWRAQGLRMRVAINLSAIQLRNPDIAAQIVRTLDKHRVDHAQLTCEITETVAMTDTKATQHAFDALDRAGIHLSIDDFGTGYSSLAYLRRLPATELKIDRSFVADLEQSEDARAIVDAVIKLAHALGLKVVAEGVETLQQAKILVQLGCNQMQGYLYGKPMPADELLTWALSDHGPKSASFRESLFAESAFASDSTDAAAG